MTKYIYAQLQFVALHQKAPSDINAALSIGSVATSYKKYTLEADAGDPDGSVGLDYAEFQFGSAQFTKPQDYGTSISYSTELGTSSRQKWALIAVSDDFVIPTNLSFYVPEGAMDAFMSSLADFASANGLSSLLFYLNKVNDILAARSLHDVVAEHLKSQMSLIDRALKGEISATQLVNQSDDLGVQFTHDLLIEAGLPAAQAAIFTQIAFSKHEAVQVGFPQPDGTYDDGRRWAIVPDSTTDLINFKDTGWRDVFIGGSLPDVIRMGTKTDFGYGQYDIGYGGGGDDILIGANDAILIGGSGSDTFVFSANPGSASFGNTNIVVADFSHAQRDRIVMRGFNDVRSFTDIMAHASQIGSNTVIDFGTRGVLTLENTSRSSLSTADFSWQTFADTVSLASPSFGSDAGAGGWSSQNLTPRVMADVNGDGKADIIGFGESATYVSLATATGFAGAAVGINSFGFSATGGGWASNDTFHRTLGDVNGDGKADIIGFGNAGIYISLATSNGQFASPSLRLSLFGTDASAGGWSSNDALPREVADINGDGMDDIVGFGNSGVWVALATGNGNFGAPFLSLASFGKDASAGGWASDTQYHRELADVNGDGMADIVGFGSSTTYVALATGGGHFAAPQIAVNSFGYTAAGGGWFTQDQYPRHLADVNGDGRADIVGFGDSKTYISYGNADGTFTSPVEDLASFGRTAAAGGWASDTTLPRMLADVDGNGAADIVGFGSGGVYIAHSNFDFRI